MKSHLTLKKINKMFDRKKILITGGTGSFGKATVKSILKSSISEIRIFSRDEKKQDEMRKEFDSNKISFFVGDVRDYRSINEATDGIDFIFLTNRDNIILKCCRNSNFF